MGVHKMKGLKEVKGRSSFSVRILAWSYFVLLLKSSVTMTLKYKPSVNYYSYLVLHCQTGFCFYIWAEKWRPGEQAISFLLINIQNMVMLIGTGLNSKSLLIMENDETPIDS